MIQNVFGGFFGVGKFGVFGKGCVKQRFDRTLLSFFVSMDSFDYLTVTKLMKMVFGPVKRGFLEGLTGSNSYISIL